MLFRCHLQEGQTDTDKKNKKVSTCISHCKIPYPDLEGSIGFCRGSLWFPLYTLNWKKYFFLGIGGCFIKEEPELVLNCVIFHPKRIKNKEMRAKTVRPKKCCLRRWFLKLASKKGLFGKILSYGFCSHFYIYNLLGLKFHTMKQNGPVELPI